jgi:hypothetical protein
VLVDVINDVGDLFAIVGAAIFLFAGYRAFTIGRVLVKGAYRTRALWTGGTAIALAIFDYATGLPSSDPLGVLAFFVIVIILLAFVDSSIKVAQEADFFHRSPLDWQRFRKPLFSIYMIVTIVGGSLYIYEPSSSPIQVVGILIWFPLVAVVLSYSAAALVVGARRTPDRSMRRFVRMLGFVIICIVLFLTIWLPFAPFSLTLQDLGSTISGFFIPAAGYFLYLAIMSLSPVGRIEKEVGATANPGESTIGQTGHPRT